MKYFISFTALALTLYACQPEHTDLTVANTAEFSLSDQVIAIPRTQLAATEKGAYPIITDNGDTLLSQLDDLDQDDQWDELVFLLNLDANQEKQLRLNWTSEKPAVKKPRTNIRFAKKTDDGNYQEINNELRPQDHSKAAPTVNYQMEGPAWENDKVAFRMYFDPRNGFDIFGKITENMILDQVGISGNYHELQDWGMDILKVNNSLGAGALALHWQDTLYRLDKTEEARFQLIAEGPVRSIFDLSYQGWHINDQHIDLRQRITIEAGKYFYTSEVFLKRQPENANLATGIVNIQADTVTDTHAGDMHIMATHAKQAFNGEYLGMAILADQDQSLEVMKTADSGKGITQTYVLLLNQQPQPVKFYFFAAWELTNSSFADQDSFIEAVEKAALQLSTKPEVTVN